MLHLLLFLFSLVGGVFLVFFHNPAISFALYETVYFFYPQNRWWGNSIPDISYSFFTVFIMAVAYVLNYRKTTDNHFFTPPQNKWIIFIFLLFLIATFFTPNIEKHNQAVINYGKLIVIYFFAYKLVYTRKSLDYILWGYIFGSWYISFVAFQLGRNAADRLEGIGTVDAVDSNGVAAAIAPSLIIAFYYFWINKKFIYKAAFACAGIFIANALVLVNSRGGFLAATASFVLLFAYLIKSRVTIKRQKKYVIIVMITGIFGFLSITDDVFLNRFDTLSSIELNKEKETGATRTFFWLAAIDMARDFPLGAGVNGFIYYAPLYIPEDVATGRRRNRAVHSTWFEALSEIGYLGLIGLIALVVTSFLSLQKCKYITIQKNDYNGYYLSVTLQASLLAFVIAMTFVNRLRADVFYWCILYSACAYNIYYIQSSKLEKDK